MSYRSKKVLDGYVKLINKSGDDELIARAARVSRGGQWEFKYEPANAELLKLLMAWGHETPFEFADATFEVRCPIYIARQWMRHRTFSYMESSGRYRELPKDIYIPPKMECDAVKDTVQQITATYAGSFAFAPNEDRRSILPLGTYTTFWFKGNLRNLMHFLDLRLDKAAQTEMRQYAEAIKSILENEFPWTMYAYSLYGGHNTKVLSEAAHKVLKKIYNDYANQFNEENVDRCVEEIFKNDPSCGYTEEDRKKIKEEVMKFYR